MRALDFEALRLRELVEVQRQFLLQTRICNDNEEENDPCTDLKNR